MSTAKRAGRGLAARATSLLDAAFLTQADDTPAITYIATDAEPVVLTRSELDTQTSTYAAGLAALGIRPGDLILIAHTQNLESICLFWAAIRQGAIPSMFPTLTEKLDPDVYMRDMATLVANSNVRAVFTTDEFAPTLQVALSCEVFGTADIPTDVNSAADDSLPADSTSVAFLQHSSGTTGLQKGVALSHAAALNQLASYSESIDLQPKSDVIVSWLPLYHDMGLIAGFLLPLVQGVPLVLMSPFDWVRRPALLLRAITDYNGTLCWLPNFAYNHMARRIRSRDLDGIDLESMRMFVNCSEPVYAESHALFVEKFADNGLTPQMLGVSYAMAENTFAVTQTPPGSAAQSDTIDPMILAEEQRAIPMAEGRTFVSCGQPIEGTQVRVLDEGGIPLPERQVGQIAVKSNCMLSAYYERPDLDPFTEDSWYLTGDMGYVDLGEVYVIGRQKDLIINAGKNVYPQDIEAIVNTVSGIKPGRAVAFGVPDEREGTELIAVVAEVTAADIDERGRIKRAVRQAVASQSTVTVNYVSLVDEKWLLKTSSGKLARAANREKWLSERP